MAVAPASREALAAANRTAGVVALAGVIVLVIGTFLPWAGISDSLAGDLDFDTTANGWGTLDGETGDGPLFVLAGFVVALFAILALKGIVNLGTKIAAIVVSAITIFLVVAEIASIANDNDDLSALGLQDPLSYEFGLLALGAGALVMLVGSILFRRRPA